MAYILWVHGSDRYCFRHISVRALLLCRRTPIIQTVQGQTMYRKMRKADQFRQRRTEAMQRGREAARMARPAPERAPDRPDLRMEIIVRRFDCGKPIEHRFEFHNLARVDQYRVTLDGKPWQPKIGLSKALALIRMALPRLPSARRVMA